MVEHFEKTGWQLEAREDVILGYGTWKKRGSKEMWKRNLMAGGSVGEGIRWNEKHGKGGQSALVRLHECWTELVLHFSNNHGWTLRRFMISRHTFAECWHAKSFGAVYSRIVRRLGERMRFGGSGKQKLWQF
jgi:hypothetical protein